MSAQPAILPVEEMPPGPELNALVAEKVVGMKRGHCQGTLVRGGASAEGIVTAFRCDWCGREILNDLAGLCPNYPFPDFSRSVEQAWKVRNSYLRWRFVETEEGLEVSVRLIREMWERHYRHVWPLYEESGVLV